MSRPQQIDGILLALADPARRGVVELLRRKPRRAGELATCLDMSGPALSRHLRLLRNHGLVEETHEGEDARVRTYRLRPAPFRQLGRWIDEVEQFWTLELAAFKEYAERTRKKDRK